MRGCPERSCEPDLPCPKPDPKRQQPVRSESAPETHRRSRAVRRRPGEAQRIHRRQGNSLHHTRDNALGCALPIPSHAPTTMRNTIQLDTILYSLRHRTSEPTPGSMSGRIARPIHTRGNSTRIRSGTATIPMVRKPASSIQRWSNTTDRPYRGANRTPPSAATPRLKSCPGRPRSHKHPTAMPHGRTGDQHTRHFDRRRSPFGPGPTGQNHPCRSGGSPLVRPGPHRFRSRMSLGG